MKCRGDWEGGVVYHDDERRHACFRSYATAADSYRDHSDFLRRSGRYAFLFELDPTDYEGWAYGLKKAGYATNVRYSLILIKLIKDYNLQQYSLIAMGKLRPEDEVVLSMPGVPEVNPIAARSSGDAGGGTGAGSDNQGGVTAVEETTVPATAYPEGEFEINKTRVVFARTG